MRLKWLRDIAVRLGSISAVALTLAACGAVTGTSQIVGGDLQVLPAVADLFPDVPTQFSISGGTPGYSVFSSNSIVLPLDLTVNDTSFTAVPRNVTADTPVTITVRDKNGKTNTAAVTVKPAVLNNIVTFTALPPDGVGCGTDNLCSGGNAQVVVTALLNGTVLQNRPIRFDVYQGDYRLVTPLTGVLVNTFTINTDERGEALIRLTAAVAAPTQVATLTITDLTSGLVRRFNFNIVSRTFSVLPNSDITFTGATGSTGTFSPISNVGQCPNDLRADYYIFGGAPPYRVVSPLPSVVLVGVPGSGFGTEGIVTTSGGRIVISVVGCGSVRLIITDATGTTIETAQIIGVRGPDAPAPAATIPVVSPPALSPPDFFCGQSGTAILSGTGTWAGTIATVGGSPGFSITPTSGTLPGTVTVTRSPNPLPATPTTVVIYISNAAGTSTLTVTSGVTTCP